MTDYQSLFEIRIATYDDIDDILSITKEAFEKYIELAGIETTPAMYETYDDVKKDIDNKIVLIAFADEVPVGSARIEILDDETAYFSRFGVKLTSQNNGIGKSMMNLVDRILISKGIKRLCLHTGAKITSLIRFYYGRGFYIDSTDKSKGYVRAFLVKEYK